VLATTANMLAEIHRDLRVFLEASMLVKISLVLLLASFLGAVGVYSVDSVQHALLLAGLLLMLLAFARARERAVAKVRRSDTTRP